LRWNRKEKKPDADCAFGFFNGFTKTSDPPAGRRMLQSSMCLRLMGRSAPKRRKKTNRIKQAYRICFSIYYKVKRKQFHQDLRPACRQAHAAKQHVSEVNGAFRPKKKKENQPY